ncbi:hypothetical protein [Erythrobacter aureus]|uniref:hypothetical protein n=1 Tax=Erythrobacter aureus TaxID=2182384 RepID=UPI0013B3E1FE|nr:hypothetical protein [Erythrobacter aureus]
MIAAALLLAAPLAGCGPELPPEQEITIISWEDDAIDFCLAKDSRWMMDITSRISQALPGDFTPGSLLVRGSNIPEKTFDGRTDIKELALQLVAERDGETVNLSAYGILEPGSCRPTGLHVIQGYNRWEPPMRIDVAPEA